MRALFLSLIFISASYAFAAVHPASQFIKDIGGDVINVMEQKSDSARFSGMCTLLKSNLESAYMAGVWLGNYRNLNRDQVAIREFVKLVPSILIHKAIQAIGTGEVTGSFSASDTVSNRGSNIFGVPVRITFNSKSYSATAIVSRSGNTFKLRDGEYFGFSGINYMKSEFQDVLNDAYNKDRARSMPVTALVDYIKSQANFLECP